MQPSSSIALSALQANLLHHEVQDFDGLRPTGKKDNIDLVFDIYVNNHAGATADVFTYHEAHRIFNDLYQITQMQGLVHLVPPVPR